MEMAHGRLAGPAGHEGLSAGIYRQRRFDFCNVSLQGETYYLEVVRLVVQPVTTLSLRIGGFALDLGKSNNLCRLYGQVVDRGMSFTSHLISRPVLQFAETMRRCR